MRALLKEFAGLPWTIPRVFFASGEKLQKDIVERLLPDAPRRPPGQEVRAPEGGYLWFSDEQVASLQSLLHEEGPIVMVSTFRFRPDGGAERFDEYVRRANPIVTELGARILYLGQSGITFIGPEKWDLISLVEYPSVRAYYHLNFENEAFDALKPLRASALLDSRFFFTRKQSE